MKGLLSLIESNHDQLRTKEVYGDFWVLPQVGSRFLFKSEPLDHKNFDMRVISTSPVVEVYDRVKNSIMFKTENSLYRLYLRENMDTTDAED